MTLTRRSLLHSSLGLVAAGSLARPYIANAAATTAEVWWVQGFIQEEDVSFKKIVADYEKASGNKIDYSIIPFAPGRQKIVAAMTSGIVPDMFTNNPAYAQVQNEHVWMQGWMDIIQSGMAPQAAAEKAFKRVEEIFAKYPITQG